MSDVRDMQVRMKVHHVTRIERKDSVGFQGPYRDVLYFYQYPDNTFMVQNGDLRFDKISADEFISICECIGNEQVFQTA